MMEGGCLCGALRYGVTESPLDSGYCHCRICQRSTGAPVLAWTSVPANAFSYLQGSPATYSSSPWGQREFCATCGTQICYRDIDNADTLEINVGSLDDPASCAPTHHIYTASRIAWFDTSDDLPRYPGSGPDSETPP